MDFVPSKASAFDGYAKALRGKRGKVMLQMHIGADYSRRRVWVDHRP